MKHWYTLQHDQVLKPWCSVKEASPQRPHSILFHVCEISRIGKSTKTKKNRLVAACGGGRGNGEWQLRGVGILSGVRKIFWNWQTTLNKLKAIRLYTWKAWIAYYLNFISKKLLRGFPGGSVVKNLPANAGDLGSIPGSGRSPGEGNGYPFQYSFLEMSMARAAWWAYSPWGHKKSDTPEHAHTSWGKGLAFLWKLRACRLPEEGMWFPLRLFQPVRDGSHDSGFWGHAVSKATIFSGWRRTRGCSPGSMSKRGLGLEGECFCMCVFRGKCLQSHQTRTRLNLPVCVKMRKPSLLFSEFTASLLPLGLGTCCFYSQHTFPRVSTWSPWLSSSHWSNVPSWPAYITWSSVTLCPMASLHCFPTVLRGTYTVWHYLCMIALCASLCGVHALSAVCRIVPRPE